MTYNRIQRGRRVAAIRGRKLSHAQYRLTRIAAPSKVAAEEKKKEVDRRLSPLKISACLAAGPNGPL